MKCEQVEQLLDQYLDGELGDAEGALLREHVEECHGCAARFGTVLAAVEGLEQMPELRAPSGLTAAVLAGLPEIETAAIAPRMGWALGLAGAVLTALIVLALPELMWVGVAVLGALGAGVEAVAGALPAASVWMADVAAASARGLSRALWVGLLANMTLLGAALLSIGAWVHRKRLMGVRVSTLAL